ncbi:hypothetical protein FCU94_13315 [Vibrio sp. JPW-9-11-11]|nr:hypothetical protein [Vibrio sp. JPW-9-11-11]
MKTNLNEQPTLCCPLCGSQEYLLSESDNMLCAECGSFFESVTQITPLSPSLSHGTESITFVGLQYH